MKKIITYIVLIIIVAVAIYHFASQQSASTLEMDETAFAVANTDEIDKIVLKNRRDDVSVLQKDEEGAWRVNDGSKVNESRLETLLETIRRVEVKAPVPQSMRDRVIKNLAASSVKVEIYQNDNLARAYYIGGKTPDQTGTYMIIDGAREPYITHIPGFFGYLSVRYFAEPHEWVTPRPFPFRASVIKAVESYHTHSPEMNFRIEQVGSEYTLFAGENLRAVNTDLNKGAIRDYLMRISAFQFEGKVARKSGRQIDSLFNLEPLGKLIVEPLNGEKVSLVIQAKPADIRTKTLTREEGYDADKRIGFINNNKEQPVLLQALTLLPLMPDPLYFTNDEILSEN